MARRVKFYQWSAKLSTDHTDGLDVWGGWQASREMSYGEALEEARAQFVAAMGEDFADLAQYVEVS